MTSAVILAAGRGSRLLKLTDDRPKCLLPLNPGGDTLLDHNLDALEEIGVSDLHIVTGYRSEQIEEHCRQRGTKANFIYNPFWKHCNVLGSFYLSFPCIRSDFFFLHADTLAEPAIWDQLAAAQDSEIVLPYDTRDCAEEEMKVRIENGRLVEISKAIEPASAAGEFIGIARFQQRTLATLQDLAIKEFRTGTLNQYMESLISGYLLRSGSGIKMLDITGLKWVEIDFPEDYEKARSLFGKSAG